MSRIQFHLPLSPGLTLVLGLSCIVWPSCSQSRVCVIAIYYVISTLQAVWLGKVVINHDCLCSPSKESGNIMMHLKDNCNNMAVSAGHVPEPPNLCVTRTHLYRNQG